MSCDAVNGWTEATLGDVCDIRAGYGFPKHLQGRTSGELPFAKVGDISHALKNGGFELHDATHFITRLELDELRARSVPAGSVVFAKIGEAIRLNRRAITTREMVVDNNVMALVPFGAVDSRFLLHQMRTISLYEHAGATTVPSIRKSTLDVLPFQLPPLPEQRRIVAKIEALQARSRRAREELEAIPPLLDKLRQSVLAAAFRGDLTADWRAAHPDVEPASVPMDSGEEGAQRSRKRLWGSGSTAGAVDPRWHELPPTWSWVRVQELGPDPDSVVQIGPMSMKSKEFVSSGTTVLNVGCVQWGRLELSKANYLPAVRAKDFERYRIRGGDVMFTRSGTVGRSAVVPLGVDALMTFHLLRVRTSPHACLPHYLYYAFQGCPAVLAQIEKSAMGATRAGFNTRLLAEMWVPLAPQQEQEELVRRVNSMFEGFERFTSSKASALEHLQQLDQSILTKAFRGELVPQDPADEPVSVLLERIRAEREAAGPKPNRRGRKSKAAPVEDVPPEPEPAAAPVIEEPEPKGQLALFDGEDFMAIDADAQVDAAHTALLGAGAMPKEDAVRQAADQLRELGMADFKRLRKDGHLYAAIEAAVERGGNAGAFDRPGRGKVRAVKASASDYDRDDWVRCLLAVIGDEPVDRDDAMRMAAEWAHETMGLAFVRLRSDGVIMTGLKSALNSAIRRGLVDRVDARRVRRA